jgi:hypothetical protein
LFYEIAGTDCFKNTGIESISSKLPNWKETCTGMDTRYQVALHGQVTVFEVVFNKLEVEREQAVQHAQRPIKLRCSELSWKQK